MSIRVLCYGSNGWIGKQLFRLCVNHPDVIWIHSAESRADDIESVRLELDSMEPTHVLNCIGRTHGVLDGKEIPTIDYLEYPGKLVDNVRDNLFAPLLLAHECKQRGIHYTYMGTGCIFEYDETHPFGDTKQGFTELDKPNFFGSSYSIVKGYTDQMMQWTSALNVRIRMPITTEPNPRDFITKIVGYERICSMENSMTVLDELLPLLVDMMVTYRTGTIQLTNTGTISHDEILTMYKEIVDPSKTWTNMSYDEQSNCLKSKRSNNALDTTKLESWYKVNDIKTAVRLCLEKRKKF